ncbi:MAG: hypothetical protein INH02_16165 [Gemmatimonas sp.]|uniref:hypothetical protein n=1 Tax=Gemmatimonas sp. TaxID=1962908 RepID=UPI0025C69732|nr:hypothetical protein [Gemmatimonas sp.]MCA2988948.1 hypothetical protein [Gemmatimonas sp.]
MNRQQLLVLIAFCAAIAIGPLVGPALGEFVNTTFGDGPFWQVLPWLLIAAVWVFLWRIIKRAPPTP